MTSTPGGDPDPSSGPRWDGGLYARNTAHHRAFDRVVLEDVPLRPGSVVLDVGCGTGDLTATVADLVDAGGPGGGRVLGVDADPSMVDQARAARGRPGLEFAVGRAQDLPALTEPASYDVVLSVAVLHWIPAAEHPAVFAGIRRALKPGAVLRAEFGGRGQIAAARAVLDAECAAVGGEPPSWTFADPAETGAVLRDTGLVADRIRLLHQRRALPTFSALTGWLDSQVLVAYRPQLPEAVFEEFRRTVLSRAVGELRRDDGSYDQDYVRLDLLARAC